MNDTSAPPSDTGHAAGQPAVSELVELLQLRVRPVALVAGGVVLLGLVLTLVAPGAVPSNWLVGTLVGLLALVAAVVVGVWLDANDPRLLGPRHLRRDGHQVLARIAGRDLVLHGGPLVDALARRAGGDTRVTLALAGGGVDVQAAAEHLGATLAARGIGTLVIDLRADDVAGVAEVAAGVARLAEVAERAQDRPYAWVAGGARGASQAAAAVVDRPPRDVKVLLVVAPEVPTTAPEALGACGRALVFVPTGVEQRATVTSRLASLGRLGVETECVVVDDDRTPSLPVRREPLGRATADAASAPAPFSMPSAATEPAAPAPDVAAEDAGGFEPDVVAPEVPAPPPAPPAPPAAPAVPDRPVAWDESRTEAEPEQTEQTEHDGHDDHDDHDGPGPSASTVTVTDVDDTAPEADAAAPREAPTTWDFRSEAASPVDGAGAADLRTAATLAFLDVERGASAG